MISLKVTKEYLYKKYKDIGIDSRFIGIVQKSIKWKFLNANKILRCWLKNFFNALRSLNCSLYYEVFLENSNKSFICGGFSLCSGKKFCHWISQFQICVLTCLVWNKRPKSTIKSANTEHIAASNHVIGWDEAKLKDQEFSKTTRWLNEAILMGSRDYKTNKEMGDRIYDQIISKRQPTSLNTSTSSGQTPQNIVNKTPDKKLKYFWVSTSKVGFALRIFHVINKRMSLQSTKDPYKQQTVLHPRPHTACRNILVCFSIFFHILHWLYLSLHLVLVFFLSILHCFRSFLSCFVLFCFFVGVCSGVCMFAFCCWQCLLHWSVRIDCLPIFEDDLTCVITWCTERLQEYEIWLQDQNVPRLICLLEVWCLDRII